jgi:tetratricopeptide (TPR) repeat protein
VGIRDRRPARRLAAKALASGGPADVRAPTLRYTALYALGRFADARAAIDTMRASPLVLRWRGAAAARAGDTAGAERALAALAPFDGGYARRDVAVERAGILAALGRRDEAVRALEEARALGRWVNVWSLVGPGYESLRGYPPADAVIAAVD